MPSSDPPGEAVVNWSPRPAPRASIINGHYCRVEPLDVNEHASDLFRANCDDAQWTYLPYGPFAEPGAYRAWLTQVAGQRDPLFFALRDLRTGRCAGVASYLRVDRDAGSIEVGHLNFSPELQHSRAATEAMFLMMQWVFESGYRRYEWKCHALNIASRRAAQRLGFSYEGVFRQHRVVKGKNRDTAWFACIDREWPALQQAYLTWLDPANFAADGQQRQRLSVLTQPLLATVDPLLAGDAAD